MSDPTPFAPGLNIQGFSAPLSLKHFKLIAFDMDSTLINIECVDEIADAVGNDIDIICDGGIRRGTHVIKALAAGAKACSGGRMYLYALAAAGQPGVEKALGNMRSEIERDMKLMGVTKIDQLNRDMLRYR